MTTALYNISHYGYLVYAICHNMVSKHDMSIIMIDTGWLSEETLNFLTNGNVPGFSEVLLYSEYDLNKKNETKFNKNIRSFFDKLLSERGLKIEDFDEIYTHLCLSQYYSI